MRREQGCFSISSYNIHRCIGSDGRMDPERISQVIHEMDCDIVGLQEVDSHRSNGGLSYQMDYLSDATGMVAIPGPTIQTDDRHYGNVLLSAHPVLDVRRLDLSIRGRENRGALDVDVEVHGRRVRVVVTHFGLFGTERRQQTARLLGYLGTAYRGMCILLGDINNWLPFGPMSHRLNFHFGRTPLQRTYPAFFPIFGLDRIWVSPPRALLDISVHRSRLARMASDHLPLKAIIRAL